MAFFNEFPHTRTYDSDLAWLIKRMKEVLSRMDSVEARMQALEDLVRDFINTANIPELIKQTLQELIDNGTFYTIMLPLFDKFNNYRELYAGTINFGAYAENVSNNGYRTAIIGNFLAITLYNMSFAPTAGVTGGYRTFQLPELETACANAGVRIPQLVSEGAQEGDYIRYLCRARLGGSTQGTSDIYTISFIKNPSTNNTIAITIPYGTSAGSNKTYLERSQTMFIPIEHI